VFEIGLGILLILNPLERGDLAYTFGSLWALLVGALLIGDALRMRVPARRGSAAPTGPALDGTPILQEGQHPDPFHEEDPH